MSSKYNQVASGDPNVHFSKALFGETQYSKMNINCQHLTTFNAGDIVPIMCREILPDEEIDMSLSFVVRQSTLLTPTMGQMDISLYAFFVPNRIVNKSWKAVQGENYSGSWVSNNIVLAPLQSEVTGSTQIPVGSVADYYGFPTQQPIPNTVLNKCHDLKFRGYVMIYNEYFRDQNYQPPIPISYLNVYQGFFDDPLSTVGLSGSSTAVTVSPTQTGTGSYSRGAVASALYGSGTASAGFSVPPKAALNSFRATSAPLKANKHHDYFTSVLPSPQKSLSQVVVPLSDGLNAYIPDTAIHTSPTSVSSPSGVPLKFFNHTALGADDYYGLYLSPTVGGQRNLVSSTMSGSGVIAPQIEPSNLYLPQSDVTIQNAGIDLNDLRLAAATQQIYETLARGGSRYREIIRSFFGIYVDDPFDDIPTLLGKIHRSLDLYQTAQTSESGSTPQGNLAAFGYTSTGGHLFKRKFIEHGYLHIFAVVRHRNIYPSYLARDNMRRQMLDFYNPQLANISEQPVFTREINPFVTDSDQVFGYQEAWAEYRYAPDNVSGYMRPGVEGSLSVWNYADDFDSGLTIADATWLKSNSAQVLDRTLAVTSATSPQLKAQFKFSFEQGLPMPTSSVPGMDII